MLGRLLTAWKAIVFLELLLGVSACKSGVRDQSEVRHEGAPPDIRLSTSTADLSCADDGKVAATEACRLVEDFASAEPFVDWPSDEGESQLWVGRRYATRAGQPLSTGYFFLQLHPGDQPAPSLSADALRFVLPAGHLANPLIAESESERADMESALTALAKGESPAQSAALEFARAAEPTLGYSAVVQSSGASAILLRDTKFYFRQHGDRIVAIEDEDFEPNLWLTELWRVPNASP